MMLSFLNFIKPKQSNATKSEMADTAQCWTVYVDSNYHYMNEDERHSIGSFESYDDALLACQKIVDEFLISSKDGRRFIQRLCVVW